MVGRTGDNGAASIRALRRDLMDALRACEAEKPAPDKTRSRFAALPEAMRGVQSLEKPAPIEAPNPTPPKPAIPGRSAQIRASFQAELSPEVGAAVGFLGRCFALPEIAALLSLCGRAITHAGDRLRDEPRSSRRRISASKLTSKRRFKLKLLEA